MPENSQNLPDLEMIGRKCDQFLDESPTYAAYIRDVLAIILEHACVDAAALVEFSNPEEPKVAAQENLNAISLDGFFSIDMDHVALMRESIQTKKTLVVADRSLPEAGLKRHCLIMHPVVVENHPPHLLEIFTLQTLSEKGATRLQEVVEVVSQYLVKYLLHASHSEQSTTTDAEFWEKLDLFLLKLQKSLDLTKVIAIAVNDGRALIGADRVSIALQYGNRTSIKGVSGQERVQHRANLVQAMTQVARTAIKIGQPITYKGTIENLPPELESPLADYLTESRSRMIMFVPLCEPEMEEDFEEVESKKVNRERTVIGCLIIEQATETRPRQNVVNRTELLKDHIEVAIYNCHRHETIFLLSFWRAIGKTLRWFKGRRRWIAAAILSGLFALGLVLAFVTWEYRVEGDGQAMPKIQHEVFAPWNGNVVKVLVESGQSVDENQPLLQLESDDLDAERIATKNEQLEKEKLVAALTTQRAEAIRRDNSQELIRLSTELAQAVIEFEGATAKLAKIAYRIEKLTVRSPADGVVATFQIDLLLRNRPVNRGELLVEIMQPDGPWRLELQVPEHRMGHIMRSLKANGSIELPVDYILATSVEKSFEGTLSLANIATRSSESEAAGTVVEVYVDIDPDDISEQSLGAAVTAKIHCGKKSLFYVLFGDVVEFFQRHLWL